MSPSIRTMGFFMSEINFCNTKEQLNHLGEVATGKVDGSPSGADIDTSKLPYTGQVRKTLPALESEYETSIATKQAEAEAAIDEYRLLNKGPYAAGVALESKFEYITYNGESYFATNPPYTTTATTPDADVNLFAGGYTTLETVANKIGNPNLLSNHNFLTPSPEDITHPSETSTTYAAGTQIFSGVYAGDSGCTITYTNGRVNCSAGSYNFKAATTNSIEYVPAFTASTSDYDGMPSTIGVSASYFGDYYLISVTPDAGDVFSVKFEQGDIATRHEVGLGAVGVFKYNLVTQMLLNPPPPGSTCSTGGTKWERDDTTGEPDINNFRVFNDIVNARDFGAKGDGSSDDWDAINEALQTYRTVWLDTGSFAVSKTVLLRQNQHLKLGSDVTLIMPESLTASLEPVVFMLAPFATLKGTAQRSSYIKKESRCPDGVVKLGMPNMASSTNNCFQCEISGVTLYGPQLYGQVSGDPDVALHLPSPEINPSHFNYFHTIKNVGVEDVNIGIWLRGWANGMFISNIYGSHIGNTSIQSAFILHQGALDNMITDIFFNQSNNVTGLIVEDLDNTANGSPTVMQSQHNTYKGMVFEQGGTSELACDIRASRSSYFEVRDNVTSGSLLFSDFQNDNNTFFSSRTVILPLDTSTKRLEVTGRLNLQRSTIGDSSQEGMTVGEGFTNSITKDNDIVMLYNRINGGGVLHDYRIDGASVGRIWSTGSGIISYTGVNYGLQMRDTFVAPTDSTGNIANNQLDLGTASGRFKTAFLINSPDVSSDRTLKTDEQVVPDWIKSAALEIKGNINIWRWIHKVEMSSSPLEGDNARYHVGPMAQDVISILESHAPEGEDVFKFGMVSKYIDSDGVERLSIKPIEIIWAIMAAIEV